MKLPRFKLWSTCLAVAASAVVIRLAMMAGPLLTITTPLLFLGPMSGIVLERQRGGNGVSGGVIAGIFSGLAVAAFLNIYAYRLGRPFAWLEWMVSTAAFVLLEASCGWLWGRQWHSSMADRPAADPEENPI